MTSYPRNSCENIKNKAGLTCSSDQQIQCGSLFPGHHQDCQVTAAHGGWLQCLDLTKTNLGSSPCQEEDYGIHRDNVWVQNGCQGNFYTCYVPVAPQEPVEKRTLECTTNGNSYKQCQIDGAYLVNSVHMKIQLNKNKTCTEGINYGIVADSIFVKDGCNGIFTVDFFPESAAPPVPPQPPSTTTTTTSSQRPKTTITERTPPSTRSPLFSSTTRSIPLTTNHTAIRVNPTPSTDSSGSIMVLTAAAVLGVFLVVLLAVLATLWFSRRYHCTKRYLERKPKDGPSTIEGPSGNIYEEISTDEVPPSAPPVYERHERQPFITQDFSGHECALEHNNNPNKSPLGENYFILDPKYRDCHTLPLNRNIHHNNFEPEYFHSNAPDHRACQIHRPIARVASTGHSNHSNHEPVIRMGTFNPKIHQYPLTIGPVVDPNMFHKQNTLPVFNGKAMRISDSDVDEDGYQKIGTFGPQQKHFQNIPAGFQNIPANYQGVPPNINNVPTSCVHSFQPVCVSEQLPNSEPNPNNFDTSSC